MLQRRGRVAVPAAHPRAVRHVLPQLRHLEAKRMRALPRRAARAGVCAVIGSYAAAPAVRGACRSVRGLCVGLPAMCSAPAVRCAGDVCRADCAGLGGGPVRGVHV